MTSQSIRSKFTCITATVLFAAVLAFAHADSVSAAGAANNLKLVERAETVSLDVSGSMYDEYDPNVGWIRYPVEGKFSMTLSPVSTDHLGYDENGNINFAWWEQWRPLIRGTVTIHKPDGDVSFNTSWRGVCRYNNNYYYGGLYCSTVLRVHETGQDFNEVSLRLSGYTPEGKLPDAGEASVNLSSDLSRKGMGLSGTYTAGAAAGWGETGRRNTSTEYQKAQGTMPRFRMVDQSMLLTVNLSGVYRIGRWPGTATYPADAKLSVNVKPNPTQVVYHTASEWGEEYDAWWDGNPVSIQGTIVIHKPEGDLEFHVRAAGTPVSGYDAYYRPLGPYPWQDGMWHNGIPAAIESPIHESGKNKLNFYGDDGGGGDALLELDCINPDGPQMIDHGTAYLYMTDVNGTLDLRDGTYEASN